MEIIITGWALDSYLELKHQNAFTSTDYKQTIRPDVLLLVNFPQDAAFRSSKFWSQATDGAGNRIHDGYKMKWHNMGNGQIQLRLPVGTITDSFLCEAYVKTNKAVEKRKMARFKTHLQLIRKNCFTERGRLK